MSKYIYKNKRVIPAIYASDDFYFFILVNILLKDDSGKSISGFLKFCKSAGIRVTERLHNTKELKLNAISRLFCVITRDDIHIEQWFKDEYSNLVVKKIIRYINEAKKKVEDIIKTYDGKVISLFPLKEVKHDYKVDKYKIYLCKKDLSSIYKVTNSLSDALEICLKDTIYKNSIKNVRSNEEDISFDLESEKLNIFERVHIIHCYGKCKPSILNTTTSYQRAILEDICDYLNNLTESNELIELELFQDTVELEDDFVVEED